MPLEIKGERYFSTREVVKVAGVSRTTLWRWRARGAIPCGQRLRDRQVVFTRAELEEIRGYADRLEPALPGNGGQVRRPVPEGSRHDVKLDTRRNIGESTFPKDKREAHP